MLTIVAPGQKRLDDYREVMGEEAYQEIKNLAGQLAGKKVLHVNATAHGGGVAEILKALVPLTNNVGLQADWAVMEGSQEFFQVTKAMHNSLQGNTSRWTRKMWDLWGHHNELNAEELGTAGYDFVVIHDPQPAAMLSFLRRKNPQSNGRWVWRCHIDLTDAQMDVWETLRPFVELYDYAVFTLPEFAKGGLNGPEVVYIPPAIDPLTPKNSPLAQRVMDRVLVDKGIDPGRPMIAQISRFDPWKDPLGVIDAYREAKKTVTGLQLVMVAAMAGDDPEGWVYYEKTLRHAGDDPDIYFLTDLHGLGNDTQVNVIQAKADVVVQKSIREGFGLTVTEALWKSKPVVAGNVGGIRLQVLPGETGFLASSTQEFVQHILYILANRDEAQKMGKAGKEHVRRNFLITRLLRDYLRMFNRLLGNA